MFNTVLHQITDPGNVGMILRSHAAFGGNKLVITGYDESFSLNRKFRNSSRSLYKQIELSEYKSFEEYGAVARSNGESLIGVEITETAIDLPKFHFPENCSLVLGSEKYGLPGDIIKQCDAVVRIPLYGPVGSINVAIAASIAMYELTRGREGKQEVFERMYNFKPKN
jgi:23S rRNA (guanosine2251-2'-O)-methyltransferase